MGCKISKFFEAWMTGSLFKDEKYSGDRSMQFSVNANKDFFSINISVKSGNNQMTFYPKFQLPIYYNTRMKCDEKIIRAYWLHTSPPQKKQLQQQQTTQNKKQTTKNKTDSPNRNLT